MSRRNPRVEAVRLALGDNAALIAEWSEAGRRLLEVDPDRFRRYLGAAQAIVDLYTCPDGTEDATLATWLPMLGPKGGAA